MASLIMTIDSDDDQNRDHGDIIIADGEFKMEDSSDNEERREDGSKANKWTFGDQMKTDQRKDKNPEDEEPQALSMEDRVASKLEEKGIDLSHEKLIQEQAGDEEIPQPTASAKAHYDKEDLIMFHELNLSKPLVKACSDLDFDHPTVIQRLSIPAILEGHDILAHSVTGSGKTASYLLPILQKYLLLRQTRAVDLGKLRYLVLTPTRELAA